MIIKGVEQVFSYNKELKIWCGYVILPNFVKVEEIDYEPHGGITLKEKSSNKKRIYGFIFSFFILSNNIFVKFSFIFASCFTSFSSSSFFS